jgi:hypothetical protein
VGEGKAQDLGQVLSVLQGTAKKQLETILKGGSPVNTPANLENTGKLPLIIETC